MTTRTSAICSAARVAGRAQQIRDGENVEAEIEITPEEGAAGVEKRISLQTQSGTKNYKLQSAKGRRQRRDYTP